VNAHTFYQPPVGPGGTRNSRHQGRRRRHDVFCRGGQGKLGHRFGFALGSDVVTDRLDTIVIYAQSMPSDEMLCLLMFYTTGILDLQRLPQMEIADPVGL